MNSNDQPVPEKPSNSKIIFDLADVLTPQEIAAFEQSADEAGAENLTEHFLDITLREHPRKSA